MPGDTVPPAAVCVWAGDPRWPGGADVASGHWLTEPDCVPHRCLAGPKGASVPFADYAACTEEGVTGAFCNPTCPYGFHVTPPASFRLLCDTDHRFRVPFDICAPDSCRLGPNAGPAPSSHSFPTPHAEGVTCVPTRVPAPPPPPLHTMLHAGPN
eukprot:gene13010-44310_t